MENLDHLAFLALLDLREIWEQLDLKEVLVYRVPEVFIKCAIFFLDLY